MSAVRGSILATNQELQVVGQCRVCGNKTELCCERCREAFYCSPEHQKEDWRQHRNMCSLSPVSSMVKLEDIKLQGDQDMGRSEKGNEPEPMQDFAIQLKPTMEQAEQNLLKEKAKAKDIVLRAANMKKMIDTRNNERQSTLYYFFKKNSQSAIITGKRVTLLSRRIFGEFNDAVLCEELSNRFLIRTNKLLQEIEVMMDIAILAKIHLSMDKSDEIKHLLGPINFVFPTLRKNPLPNIGRMSTKPEFIEYNLWHEEVSKLCAVLNSLILICSKTRLYDITNSLFEKYKSVAETYMTDLEAGTIQFQWGTYQQNTGQMEKAFEHFIACYKIRERYGETLALSDVLYNLGLIEFYINLNDKTQAIEFVRRALRIRKNRLQEPSMEYMPLLETLGKFSMEVEDFDAAYAYFYESFSLCKAFLEPKDKTKKRSEVLLIFLYRTLHSRIREFPAESDQLGKVINRIESEAFMSGDFEQYQLRESKREQAHLHLQVTRQFFDMLSSEQTDELHVILEAVPNLNFRQGIEYIHRSHFYTTMSADKKGYFLALNPKVDALAFIVKKVMGS